MQGGGASCCWYLQRYLHIVAGAMPPIRSTRQGCLQACRPRLLLPSQHHQQRQRDNVDDMDKHMMAL